MMFQIIFWLNTRYEGVAQSTHSRAVAILWTLVRLPGQEAASSVLDRNSKICAAIALQI